MRFILATWSFIRSRMGTCMFAVIVLSVQFCVLLCLLGWSTYKQWNNMVYATPYYTLNSSGVPVEKCEEFIRATRQVSPSIDSMISGFLIDIPITSKRSFSLAVLYSQDLDENNEYTNRLLTEKNWLLSSLPGSLTALLQTYSTDPEFAMPLVEFQGGRKVSITLQNEVYTFEEPYSVDGDGNASYYQYPHAMNYYDRVFSGTDGNALTSEETFIRLFSNQKRYCSYIITTGSGLSDEELARLDRVAYEFTGENWVEHIDPRVKEYEKERSEIFIVVMLLYLIAFRIVLYSIELREKEFKTYSLCGESSGALIIHKMTQVLSFLAVAVVLGSVLFFLIRIILRNIDLEINLVTSLRIDMSFVSWAKYTGIYVLAALIWFILYSIYEGVVKKEGAIWRISLK
ncbi:MAG: hypothetical protein IKX68_01760 [Clostridiales bacterium]|nr:hypothetical protein [Clostridiales bacterium]